MSSTGNVFAGTGENNAGIGATAWTNPGNITATDANDATCNAGASSQYLVARNFGLSVPAGSAIVGVTVRVNASEHSAGTETLNARLQDAAGALTGTAKTASLNGITKAVYTYGSTSDVWGATLDSTVVNDVDFGVRLWFTTSHDVRIDYVTLAVEYTSGTTALNATSTTITSGRGTLAPDAQPPLVGTAATGGQTAPTVSGAKPLTGSAITSGQGFVARGGGQAIVSGQGSVTPAQQLVGTASTVGQGTVSTDANPPTEEDIFGEASTFAQGTSPSAMLVGLRSRKVGGGSATQSISGQFITSSAGLFTPIATSPSTGQVASLLQGSMTKTRAAALSGAVTSTFQGAVTSSGAGGGATQTWATRSTQPGVTYKQNFSSPAAVTPFFFDNGGGEVASGYITVDTTDGAETPNCLKIVTPAGYNGTASMVFRHPLNSAWTLNNQSFGSAPFWFSWRMKINSGRLVSSTAGTGWKYFNLAQFGVEDGGVSGGSNTSAEIVGQDTNQRGFPQAYHQDGVSFPPFETSAGQGPGGDINFENAYDVGSGTNNQRYCLYGASGLGFPGCWHWPVDQWFSMKVRVRLGTYGGSTNNQFDMWAARNGETTWTHLLAWGDNVGLPFTLGVPQSGYSGSNGLHWHFYETGTAAGRGVDAVGKIDEIIVSTNDIAVPSSSPLSAIASAMAPGTWTEITSIGVDVLGLTGSQGGVGGNMIPYGNQAVWDPVGKAIRFCGNDHHGGASGWTMMEVQYLESTNTWSAVPALGISNQIPGITASHGYGHLAIRPDTGEMYLRQYGGDGAGHEKIYRKSQGGSWGSTILSPSVYCQVAIGTCWWTGALQGSGSMGAYIVWESGLGDLLIYDPGTNAWQDISLGFSSDGLYHSVCAYSPVYNCVVFGGGNATPRKLWRLNSNRTITALADPPLNVGIQSGNLQVDPVSGKFLIWGGGSNARLFYELVPTGTGTYTQLTGSRQPPAAGLHGVSDPSGGGGGPDALISCALPEHGVVAYMSSSGASYANMFLYKHA